MIGLSGLFIAATFISGVNPDLFTFNEEGECGTGAVVPWAGSVWYISYAPHKPNGSTDKLYELVSPTERKIRTDVSIGGTPANRLIHKESKQLFIGPYVIDEKKNIRVMPPLLPDGSTNLYGRLTAAARHLTDPENKIYITTMEEGVYSVDVHTLAVEELFRDGNIQKAKNVGGTLLPGYHGKGSYSGQGRLVYANNGELSPEARVDPTIDSGVLAQWNGKPGEENWQIVRRNQFTDITSRGGIYGAEHPETDPLWAIGWDAKSVLLNVLDHGKWTTYRLPKGSHSYDGAHGWNTEWPRIREIGEGDDYLMTMHGTFWHFPATFDTAHAAGIRPRSKYLKIVGDFCRWDDWIVMGCDDTAQNEFLNKRKAKPGEALPLQSNSNLWFVKPDELDNFGPVLGRGSVWLNDTVKKGDTTDPYLLAGYDKRALYVMGLSAMRFEVDEKGDNTWKDVAPKSIAPGVWDLSTISGEWIRLVALEDATNVTAVFNYANQDNRQLASTIFAPFTTRKGAPLWGVVRSGKGGEDLPLEYYANGRLMEVVMRDGKPVFQEVTNLVRRLDMAKACAIDPSRDAGDRYDKASAMMVDDKGNVWRFPYSSASKTRGRRPDSRLCREVCTERDLLNLAGTFYELPAENAGGYAKIRPIATHGLDLADYCTWRGLFVLVGVGADEPAGEHVIVSDDGKSKLWLGAADDLWHFGKPVGFGGPWADTAVEAGMPSDPYLMTGYDKKLLSLKADKDNEITLEFDITGTGVWMPLKSYSLKAGEPQVDDLSNLNAYWVRARSSQACKASVVFDYK